MCQRDDLAMDCRVAKKAPRNDVNIKDILGGIVRRPTSGDPLQNERP